MIKPIHPFPARMAPDLALMQLRGLRTSSVVLDPMAGSGTVVRQASDLGHRAVGFDTDPLAVLMTTVWNRPVCDETVERLAVEVIEEARDLRVLDTSLPWMDKDLETTAFVKYWFAKKQRWDLRRIAHVLYHFETGCPASATRAAADVLRLSLSRIIITKDQGASLARDVSHSQPHKVAEDSDFDVMAAFERSIRYVRRLLEASPPKGAASIQRGDARFMNSVADHSVDAVLTSPPYLNAIDYMRGHRLSLVWLGYPLSSLRDIRSDAIGTERGHDEKELKDDVKKIVRSMGDISTLSQRHSSMVNRYAADLHTLTTEIARVIKPRGKVIYVVGNSCLRGTFIKNSEAVRCASQLTGLILNERVERELPDRSRYLPMPTALNAPLGKRMRTETVLTFTAKRRGSYGAGAAAKFLMF